MKIENLSGGESRPAIHKRSDSKEYSGRIFLVLALSSISALALITVFIIVKGVPIIAKVGVLNFIFGMSWAPGHGEFGIFPMIVGTVTVTLGAAVLGVPIGICCSIFLSEFAPAMLRNIFRPAIQLLAGIPSVVYGFWGLLFIVPFIRVHLGGPGLSILAGSIILAIMILPTIISISEVSILALPRQYKEGALALGLTHWQAIRSVILPAAKSGIVAAVILGIGRAMGETMAVIMVLGNAVAVPESILDPVRTLTTNIGIEMGYASGEHQEALFATGIVLFIIIMALNASAQYITRKK
ncbi:MAG: phosphate ABC transporter permease subunit PstC [Treponema sp.]|nr:phosphate ABC transporter permease subunit PstC [Treponema sp.]